MQIGQPSTLQSVEVDVGDALNQLSPNSKLKARQLHKQGLSPDKSAPNSSVEQENAYPHDDTKKVILLSVEPPLTHNAPDSRQIRTTQPTQRKLSLSTSAANTDDVLISTPLPDTTTTDPPRQPPSLPHSPPQGDLDAANVLTLLATSSKKPNTTTTIDASPYISPLPPSLPDPLTTTATTTATNTTTIPSTTTSCLPSHMYPTHNTIQPQPPRAFNNRSRIGRAAMSIVGHILANQDACLKSTGLGVPERDVRKVFGNNPDTSKALRMLVMEGEIIRQGVGGRKDPFSYTIAPPGDDGSDTAVKKKGDRMMVLTMNTAKTATTTAATTAAAATTTQGTRPKSSRKRTSTIATDDDYDGDEKKRGKAGGVKTMHTVMEEDNGKCDGEELIIMKRMHGGGRHRHIIIKNNKKEGQSTTPFPPPPPLFHQLPLLTTSIAGAGVKSTPLPPPPPLTTPFMTMMSGGGAVASHLPLMTTTATTPPPLLPGGGNSASLSPQAAYYAHLQAAQMYLAQWAAQLTGERS